MNKKALVFSAIFLITGVILGAFGAHGLREVLSTKDLNVFTTGTTYQMYHGLGLLILGLLSKEINSKLMKASVWFLIVGVVLFSGSLYILSTIEITGLGAIKKTIGPITPIGGLCFVLGWLSLLLAVLKK